MPFTDSTRDFARTVAHIDLEALMGNFSCVKRIAPKSKILAMVKSNAYGHSVVEVARTLSGEADVLGVSCLSEALELYFNNIRARIVIWAGFLDEIELKTIAHYGFETVIHHFEQIDILERVKLEKPIGVWLKIDTGMNRLGFQSEQVKEANLRLMKNPLVKKPLFYMTHFSDADNPMSEKTKRQSDYFKEITADWSGGMGLANSAAILQWPHTLHDWIRPGLILYGISSVDHLSISSLGFKAVMTLTSKIIAIKEIEEGESVGYSSTWKSPKKTRVGIVSVGYGDGYPWHVQSGTSVLIDGVECPLVGRVAMDYITVDLTAIPQSKVGDSVILWGRGFPVETIAAKAGTSPYELCCQLTKRVKYQYYVSSHELNKALNGEQA